MLAPAIYPSQAQDAKFTHNLQSAETPAPLFVGVVWIVAILQKLVCDGSHNASAINLQVL